MKNTIIILFLFTLISCVKPKDKSVAEDIPERKTEKVLKQIFQKDYPNYLTNDLVKEKALKSLVSKMDSVVKHNGLEEVLLKVSNVTKNPNGKGAIVLFYSIEKEHEDRSFSGKLNFNIIGLMSEKLASRINDHNVYRIKKAHNYNRVNQDQVSLLYNMTMYSTTPNISKNGNEVSFSIGTYMAEIDEL